MAHRRLSLEEKIARRNARVAAGLQNPAMPSYTAKIDPVVEEIRNFDNRFNSETVASVSRVDMHHGFNIGNGCRWIRARSRDLS